jgi:hypothetical protein
MKRFPRVGILSVLLASFSCGRTFTNADGRKMEGEMISATERHLVLKSLKNGKTYPIDILTLSEEDQEFVVERRKELDKESAG